MKFGHIKKGDTITRMLGGELPMELVVTEIDEEFIYCGPKDEGWKFRRGNGAEVDEELGWDGIIKTGSILVEDEQS